MADSVDSVDSEPPLDDPRAPLWIRIVGFLVVVGLFALLTTIVVLRDRDREQSAPARAASAKTVPLPADNGGSMVPRTEITTPPVLPTTLPRTPRTNNEVALELERVLKRDVGFTHKVSCVPDGPLERYVVLACSAASEPAIREAPPSTVLAVVIDDNGRFVWARTVGDAYTLDLLTADPNLTCDALVGKQWPYAVVLAYWAANSRPAALDPSGDGRPCADKFALADVDSTFASAL